MGTIVQVDCSRLGVNDDIDLQAAIEVMHLLEKDCGGRIVDNARTAQWNADYDPSVTVDDLLSRGIPREQIWNELKRYHAMVVHAH